MIKKILLALLILLIAIQFIRPEKNTAEGLSESDISTKYPMPEEVKQIVAKACNDCHSNHTNYPWYANFQPVAWLLADHIKDGRRHFDLSEFASYEPWKAHHKLEELAEEVEKGEMPLEGYTMMHAEAELSKEEKETLISWANELRAAMEADSTIDLSRPSQPAR